MQTLKLFPGRRFWFIFTLCAALTAVRSSAQPAGAWDSRWAHSGIDSGVLALASRPDGTLILGGRFGGGSGTLNHLASWKNGLWSKVPATGPDGVGDVVHAAVTIGTDTYVAGEFGGSSAGEILHGIARWDGVALHSIGSGPFAGVQGQIFALTAVEKALYVAGRFTMAGEVSALNVVRWDGFAWIPLGGLGAGGSDRVSALVVGPDRMLYAGGNFQTAGGQAVRQLARWDGARWTEVGGGVNGFVQTLAWFGGELIVGGAFTQAGTVSVTNLARWNGTRWSGLGSGVNGEISALAVQGNRLLVGGAMTTAGDVAANGIAAWTGTNWEALGTGFSGGNPTAVRALLVREDGIFAGGDFKGSGTSSFSNVARWDGSAWQALDVSIEGGEVPRVLALAARNGDVVAGGSFTFAGGQPVERVALWNGTNWQALGAGFDKPPLTLNYGVDGQIYAGGQFTRGGSRIARWNGSAWEGLGSGVNGDGTVFVVLPAPDGNVYAGGMFGRIGGVNAFGVARWDGTRWFALGGGILRSGTAGIVRAMAWADGRLYVGGGFDTAGGLPASNLARWNGSAWEDVGGGVSISGSQAIVHALSVADGDLLVGGNFYFAGGNTFSHLARWSFADGTWSQPGGAPNGPVRALAILDGRLHIGGDFSAIGGNPAHGLARWADGSWLDVPGSVSGQAPFVASLAAASTNLWVAGPFTGAGDLRATDLARWTIPRNDPPVVAFVSPAAGTEFGYGAAIPIKLTASDPEGTATVVRLSANGAPLAELAGPPFEFVWSDVFPDTYQIEAVAVDASGKSSDPVRLSVTARTPAGNQPPSVTLTGPPPGQVTLGQLLWIEAAASDPDGRVIRVDFFRDDQRVGSANTPPFRAPITPVTTGEFVLRAVATDDVGGKTSSAPVTIQVAPPGAAPAAKWTFATGPDNGSSVALAADGTIYLTPGASETKLFALKPDGTTLWAYRDADAPLWSPAIADNGDIIATRWSGGLVAISSAGVKRWEFTTEGQSFGAPAIGRDGTIYFGSGNQNLYAIDGNGNKLWDYATGDALTKSAPVIAADGAILVESGYGNLICMNPNGTERWRFNVQGSVSAGAALADDGTIYIVTSLGSLFALTPDGRKIWEYKSASLSLGSAPVIGGDGTIYFGVLDGRLHAVGPDGRLKWVFKTAAEIMGTPAIDADGTVYFTGADRNIYAVFPSGFKRWSFPIGGQGTSSVNIGSDGTIYARSGSETLYAIPGTAPLASVQWPKFHRDQRQTGRGILLPQVTLNGPADKASFLQTETIRLAASATSPNGGIARVEFRSGTQLLGTDTEAPYEFAWSNPPVGAWKVNARVVDVIGGSAVSASAQIFVAAAAALPTILNGPKSVTVGPGETVTLSAEVFGAPPLSFQWLKDGQPVAQATTAVLTLQNVSPATSARYSLRVANASGAVTTESALVTVLVPIRVFWSSEEAMGNGTVALGPSGYVYAANSTSGQLVCLDRAGGLVWVLNGGINGEIVVAEDGSLYFGQGAELVSADPQGQVLWRQQTTGVIGGIARSGDGAIYITTSAGALEAWSSSGTNRWKVPAGSDGASNPSITADGSVVYSRSDGRVYLIAPDGSMKWEYNTLWPLTTKASIAPDGAIALGVGSKLLVLNPDGTKRWEYSAVGAVAQPVIGPDGTLYFGTADPRDTTRPVKGRAVVLNADGTVRWELELSTPVTTAGCLASDGTWIIATTEEVYSLNPNGTVRSHFTGSRYGNGVTIGFDGTIYTIVGSIQTPNGPQPEFAAIAGTTAMPAGGWPCAARDVRQRSDASSPPSPDRWFFPAPSNTFDGQVSSIAVVPGGIYVGGGFTVAGGELANHVSFWNGSRWLALAEGVNAPVRTMAAFGNDLFVVGSFFPQPGATAPLLMRWDGSTWSRADEGLIDSPSALAVHAGSLYATATARIQDQPPRNYLLRYDGARWNPVGQPLPYLIHQLHSGITGLYAAVGSGVYRFDGTNWPAVGTRFTDTVYGVCETPLGLFAGGNFHDKSNTGFIARWDGTAWKSVGNGLRQNTNYFGSAFALTAQGNDLLVGGFFSSVGETNLQGLARWNGTNWSSLLSPGKSLGNSGVPTALASRGSEIYAGGSFLQMDGQNGLRYFATFHDGAWTTLGPRFLTLDGQLQLMLFNFLGRPFIVETSSDLIHWIPEFHYTELDKPAKITIPTPAGANARFIRITVP